MKKIWPLAALLLMTACAETPRQEISLGPVSYGKLQGWGQDNQAEALPAFLKSCEAFDKKAGTQPMPLAQAGRVRDWQFACDKARTVPLANPDASRRYFETTFKPYAIHDGGAGLFTGYYEPMLEGSHQKTARYKIPLYEKPNDLVTSNGAVYRKQGSRLTPYDDRSQIVAGSLNGRAKVLVWVSDPIDAFFLGIQGSGRVRLPDGQEMRVGYAAQNGRGYVAVGKVLADRGEIERPVTMEKIRLWLASHPARAQQVMNENPSYVFFREIRGEGPLGAQGVALTPMRSMAVDTSYIPLGVPLWLQTTSQARLVIAQDKGGAIKGAVRGDLFWGHGPAAEQGAGEMQDNGTYYLLLPKETD